MELVKSPCFTVFNIPNPIRTLITTVLNKTVKLIQNKYAGGEGIDLGILLIQCL